MRFPNVEVEIARSGMRKCELAREIGMRPTTLSAKLHGKSAFTLPELRAIKKTLNVDMPLEHLFSESDWPERTA